MLRPAFVPKSVSYCGKALRVLWGDGVETRFPSTWLRFHVRDSPIFEPKSCVYLPQHTQFSTTRLPIADAGLQDDGNVRLRWDDHETVYNSSWLRAQDGSVATRSLRRQVPRLLWEGDSVCIPKYSFSEKRARLGEWMDDLRRYGLVYFYDVPPSDSGITQVLNTIGPLKRRTHPTDVFSVKVGVGGAVDSGKTDAVTYSFGHIGFHSDAPYPEPPRIESFLGIEYSCPIEDTVNLFVDGFKIADDLRRHYPEAFHLLSTVHIRHARRRLIVEEECPPEDVPTYQWDNVAEQPLISLDDEGDFVKVQLSPKKLSGFHLKYGDEKMDRYAEALALLYRIIAEEKYQTRVILKTGVLAVFDNWRLLHARSKVHPASSREILGVFMDQSIYKSRCRLLNGERSGLEDRWLIGCSDEEVEILANRMLE